MARTSSSVAEEQLHEELVQSYQESKRIGYVPSRFWEMFCERGAVGTAKALLAGGPNHIPDGFGTLYQLNRLDLSVEALALDERFRSLFTPEEISTARERLKKVGYAFLL